MSFHPYEHLAAGNLTNNFNFEGSNFTAGENLDFRWLQYNVDLNYNYSFYNNKYFEILAGIGINGNYARLEAESNTTGNRYTTDRTGVIGNLSGQLHFKFNRSFKTLLWINWFKDSETKYFNGKIDFVYELNSKWSLLARGTRFEQQLELVEFDKQGGEGVIFSNSAFNTIFLGVKYSL